MEKVFHIFWKNVFSKVIEIFSEKEYNGKRYNRTGVIQVNGKLSLKKERSTYFMKNYVKAIVTFVFLIAAVAFVPVRSDAVASLGAPGGLKQRS